MKRIFWLAFISLVSLTFALIAHMAWNKQREQKLCVEYCFPFVVLQCHLPGQGSTWDVVCAQADGTPIRMNAFRGNGMRLENQIREEIDCRKRCSGEVSPLAPDSLDAAATSKSP